MTTTKERIEIQAVVVPPSGESVAYGHDERGNCVTVHGERGLMLDLYHRLRQEGRSAKPGKVYVTMDPAWAASTIDRGICPTHMLSEIPEGTAVAWAPY